MTSRFRPSREMTFNVAIVDGEILLVAIAGRRATSGDYVTTA